MKLTKPQKRTLLDVAITSGLLSYTCSMGYKPVIALARAGLVTTDERSFERVVVRLTEAGSALVDELNSSTF